MVGGDVIEIEVERPLAARRRGRGDRAGLRPRRARPHRRPRARHGASCRSAAGAAALTAGAARARRRSTSRSSTSSLRRPSLDDVFLNLTGPSRRRRDPRGTARAPSASTREGATHDRGLHTTRNRRRPHKRATHHRRAGWSWTWAPRRAQPAEDAGARPRLIVFSIVQPIMQLILFAFVFGAIANLGDTGLTLQGLRRSRGPRADDGVRRRCSRASGSPTTCTRG